MGLTFITGTVKGKGAKEVSVNFLIDSGATYSLLPEKVWKAINLKAVRTMDFSLADGTSISRKVSECQISLPQGKAHSPVILGEKGDTALLGVITLEILGVVLNPFNRRLQPMRMMLA